MLDVDESIEVGVDFVVMPRRIGNTLDSFVRDEDRAEPPPRLADLRALIPRLAGPDIHTIFVWAEQRFYIQDLAPSREELDAWRAVAPPQGCLPAFMMACTTARLHALGGASERAHARRGSLPHIRRTSRRL